MSHFIVDETKCRRDGICVAACPNGACSLDTILAEPCPPVRPGWREPAITWR